MDFLIFHLYLIEYQLRLSIHHQDSNSSLGLIALQRQVLRRMQEQSLTSKQMFISSYPSFELILPSINYMCFGFPLSVTSEASRHYTNHAFSPLI
jgi:hypothetical protein